ncbi:MAG: 50S ribosomal protein L1 [Candidatus Aenigmatarchaeota archaeon]
MTEKIISAVKSAKEGAKKRKFSQSIDLSINFKNLDLKKPESKIKGEVVLPHSARKLKICIIADSLVPQVNRLADESVILIKKDELVSGFSKKAAKKLAASCDFFLAEAPGLMPLVGRNLGQVLGPRNKMPKPVPATLSDIKPLVERTKNTVKFAVKDSAVISCIVGNETMADEHVAKNIETVLRAVEALLPKGKDQVRSAYVKLTMGKPAKIDLVEASQKK